MPSTPLPKPDSDEVQRFAYGEPNLLNAYQVCLDFEEQLALTEKVRLVRILGYLLLYAPNLSVCNEIAQSIHSCKDQSAFTDLGAFFEINIIKPFKKHRGPTPTPSEHPSRPSFETTKKDIEAEITEAPRNHKEAKIQALIRDNWRCVVTGTLHKDAPADIFKAAEPPIITAYTECAHIIPEAIFFNIKSKEEKSPKRDYSVSILAVLKRFGYDTSTFSGEKVHSLTNVITMQKDIHDVFDRLELYFEATATQNHYQVKSFSAYPINAYQRDSVTFSTKYPESLPIPSPELLALHATCCKVAHLSGSAEYIDSVYDDLEEIGVLASDGTSDGLLRFQLLALDNSMMTIEA
ncbi:hypothetical protein AGABI2DRAFT_191014 [Agaricus bisporus var. bisporus H97]|uniref:hypothetical protein n=1 Tax=Agaricus bisporus var. bisporus (strain H97 / ATCC MYA-4626 / FGSC 10389) TaxID=936046 RepID=UPI00029F8040|nr:hypothetical protein AGABI2DRAFT_191014 [Agaricus bisporus var. bisporus H97]EKV48786.1 hypothetical protein AGABI2DRAFT_191014 [Agaricus bisporus var. bisporus H97]